MATRKTLLLAVLVSALATAVASAATVTIAVPDADSYVRKGEATTNFGNATNLFVKDAGSSSTTRKGYIRYDLSTLTQPAIGAELALEVITNNNPTQAFNVDVFGLRDGDAGESWIEGNGGTDNSPAGELTWNNAPANASNNNIGNEAVLLGQFTTPAGLGPVSFESPALAAFLNSDTDGQATLILRRRGGGSGANLGFAAKEHATADAAALNAITAPAHTMSITTNDGVGADSYVRKGAATTNYGNATQVVVKDSGAGSTTRKGYMRFDLSGVTDPVALASLSLMVDLNNQGGGGTTPQRFTVSVYGLDDGNAGEGWDEGAINWNNAPGNGTNNGIDLTEASLLGQFIVDNAPTPAEILFSSDELADFLNADTDGQATLILARQGGSGSYNLGFASGEHGTLAAPTLRVTTLGEVPEPVTMALLSLAACGLGGYIRKRRKA